MSLYQKHQKDFLDWLAYDKRLASNTTVGHKSHLKCFSQWLGQRSFNLKNCQLFLREKSKEGKSGCYLEGFVHTWRVLGDHLLEKGLIKQNFARQIKTPKRKKRLPTTLSLSAIKAIIRVVPDYPYKKSLFEMFWPMLFSFLAQTGLRIGELLNLKVGDLNFIEESFIVRESKTGEQRIIPIPNNLLPGLKKMITTRRLIENDYLFPPVTGKRRKQSRKNVCLDLNRRAEWAGLKKLPSCHQFRHSFITQLLKEGVNFEKVRRLAGHRDTRVTSRVYSHLVVDDLRNAINSHPLSGNKIKTLKEEVEMNRQLLLKVCKKLGIQ